MAYRYQNIKIRRIRNTGKSHFVNAIYPDVPVTNNDQYLYTTVGDRLDTLAYDIYGDQNLWWIIASANALPGDSLYPPIGVQLRIPVDIETAINKFNLINGLR